MAGWDAKWLWPHPPWNEWELIRDILMARNERSGGVNIRMATGSSWNGSSWDLTYTTVPIDDTLIGWDVQHGHLLQMSTGLTSPEVVGGATINWTQVQSAIWALVGSTWVAPADYDGTTDIV